MRASLSGMRSEARRVYGNNISIVFLAILFSLAQWHLVEQALGTGYADSIREAQQVFVGTPTWRVYQSRVLGPYIVQMLSHLVANYDRTYWLFNIFCLIVAGYLSYFAGTAINQRTGGKVSFLLFQCLFALCLDRHWLYVWDTIDIIVFYVFFIIVIRGAFWGWTVLLFAVALFNRESALFIALWLLIDPVCRWGLVRLGHEPARALDIQSMIAGAVCMVLGILTVEALRTMLLIEELGIKNGAPSIYGAHAFLTFQQNLGQMLRALTFADRQLSIVVPIFIAAILGLILRLATAQPAVFMGAGLVYLAQVAAIMIVGLVFETRIYLDFIPFVTIATASLMNAEPEAAGPVQIDKIASHTDG